VSEVAIIDSGGANIASLLIAFERLQTKAILTSNADVIKHAERVVLPGVGAAKDAMARLSDSKLIDVIRDLKQPVLGICLGMQMLCEGSEEEDVECLGVIPGTARKLPPGPNHPVPNMGWCSTRFTHSYALPVTGNTLATARHAEDFSAIVGHENFVAAQFHPERSSAAGAKLLQNFLGLPS